VGNQFKIITEPEPKNWAKYTRSLGKDIWKKVNINEYIKNLRSDKRIGLLGQLLLFLTNDSQLKKIKGLQAIILKDYL